MPDRLSLWDAFIRSGLSLEQLWLSYVGVGGSQDPGGLARSLRHPDRLADYEHDVIAQAINERFLERGGDHPAAYRHAAATPFLPGANGADGVDELRRRDGSDAV